MSGPVCHLEFGSPVRLRISRAMSLAVLLVLASWGNLVLGQSPAVVPTPAVTVPATQTCLQQLATEHPLCVVVGEGFAGQWVNTETVDEGPVQDFILGANVRGTQKTKARTAIDFIPNPAVARLLIVLNGVTNNQTVSQTPQAVIQSTGSYQFQLTKQIEFDGFQCRTWSPSAVLTIQQRNVGAATPVSHVPLVGRIASNIALSEAERRRPMSDRIAAVRVTEHVAPEFNSRLDQELSRLNHLLSETVRSQLTKFSLMPSRLKTLTTDDAILLGAAFTATTQEAPQPDGRGVYPRSTDAGNDRNLEVLPVRPLLPAPALDDGFRPAKDGMPLLTQTPAPGRDIGLCLIHETLFTDLIARTPLAGLELPDTALQRILRAVSNSSTSSDAAFPPLGTLLFAKQQPLSVSISQGELLVEVRVGFRPAIGPELPAQALTLAVRPALSADQLQVHAELRSIVPVDGERGKLSTMTEAVIRQAIEQQLRDTAWPRQFEAPRQNGQPSIRLRLENLSLAEGWLTASFAPCPPASTAPVLPEQTFQPALGR